MGCDIHIRAEVRAATKNADRLVAIERGLERVAKKMVEFDGPDYAGWSYRSDAIAALDDDRRALTEERGRLQADPDGETVGWTPVLEGFDSRGSSDYYDFSREVVDRLALSDGELLDALEFSVGYHEDAWRPLSEEARAAFWFFAEKRWEDRVLDNRASDMWRDALNRWDEENPEEAREHQGYVGDDHPLAYRKVVAPEVLARTGVRRRAASLAPEVREEIIAFFEAYEPYGDGSKLDIHLDHDDQRTFLSREPWDGRNYNLFAILADVRNGRGFAGVPTGAGFVPISDPRGIPEDAHPDTRAYLTDTDMGVDGHSHSYHTLEQLQDYDWDGQGTLLYGVVDAETYEQCIAEGRKPSGWSGGISGAGIVTFSPEGYEEWKRNGRERVALSSDPLGMSRDLSTSATGVIEAPLREYEEVKPYVRMSWREGYREAAGEAWFKTMDALAALVPPGGSPADVRVVFYFDN